MNGLNGTLKWAHALILQPLFTRFKKGKSAKLQRFKVLPAVAQRRWVVRGDWQETCHYTCGDWGQKTRPKKSVRIIDLSDMTGEEIWKKKMMKKKTVPEEYFWQQQK